MKGPVNYKYNDLKAATKEFSAENKLGEGGFGDVYKVNLCCIFQYFYEKACSKTMIIGHFLKLVIISYFYFEEQNIKKPVLFFNRKISLLKNI